jgi:hypothetical protein
MRRFAVLLWLILCAGGVCAQTADTSRVFVEKSTPSTIDTTKLPRWIIDGKLLPLSLADSVSKIINPNDLLRVDVLKPKEAKRKFGKKGVNGVVVVATRSYAVRQYKIKLGRFSVAYRQYLAANNNDDSLISYVLNKRLMDDSKYDQIVSLYQIPERAISKVRFFKTAKARNHFSYPATRYTVIVETN